MLLTLRLRFSIFSSPYGSIKRHHFDVIWMPNRRTGTGAYCYIHKISTQTEKLEKKKKTKKTSNMEEENRVFDQLVSMGFPSELATQAAAATGGDSVQTATDWILSHRNKPSDSPISSSPPPFQPKLDRFFRHNPNSSQKPLNGDTDGSGTVAGSPSNKKPKLSRTIGQETQRSLHHQPLSERMRPRTIDEVVGQDHILGRNSLLWAAIERNRLPSIIFWGPPGSGKTSIAKSIVNSSKNPSFYQFVSLSAVTSGVKDVRDVVENARKLRLNADKRTVLFVDEVHRFNKSQQDSFLPVIEDGSIVFMGATTENPSFHMITPLLSRCRVLTLNSLKPQDVESLLKQAVDDPERGLSNSVGMRFEVADEAFQFLAAHCDGDARVALNALEVSATTAAARVVPGSSHDLKAIVTLEDAKEAFQSKHIAYDRAGDQHYNLISALHKSMRGGDANATIYWLARMIEGGEEPLYIARRLTRFASEDVGLADPSALTQAVACYQACHFLGMPECNVILAQCAAYLALAPKSIAVYRAIGAAQKVVKESVGQNEGVPLHLRNAPTKLMKELGYGKEYIYTPDNPSASQSFLPASLQDHKFLDWPPLNGTSGDHQEGN